MKISGGILSRRRILVPKTSLRPTQDRVRAAVFSSLAGRVDGARVLDIFAGSGAMGLEAFSRGASFVCWVESDRAALKTLKENVELLCGGVKRARVVRDDVFRFLRAGRLGPVSAFDIVFADPPYDRDGALLKKTLYALSRVSILKTGGLLIMEQSAKAPVAVCEGWVLETNKAYGGTRVCFFRKTKEERNRT